MTKRDLEFRIHRIVKEAVREALAEQKGEQWHEAQDRKWGKLSTAVANELNRLTHGPFTLAEAIASGRPFRRKAWDDRKGWMREISDEYDAGQRLEFVKTDWGFGGCVEADDTTACDYELMQEGGE